MADFNNDGYSDVLYIGTMNPDNVNWTGEDTGGICGGGECKGNKPLPSLYLGNAKHELTYAPELLIDKRKDSGMSLGYRQLLLLIIIMIVFLIFISLILQLVLTTVLEIAIF